MNTGIFKRALVPVMFLSSFCTLLSCDNNIDEYNENLQQTKINIISGNNQSERIGVVLPTLMTVQTTDFLGNLRTGIQIYFSTNDSGAVVTPPSTITDTDGFASCRFQLGLEPGEQHVSVISENGSITFTATAEELQCFEESPEAITPWPSGHIFITTNYSSLITGTGSVIIDFNPETKNITKVLETNKIIIDLSFSPRGELFVASDTEIFKVTPDPPHELESYVLPPSETRLELKPNPGGILVGSSQDSVFIVNCPGENISGIYTLTGISPENLAVDQINRDLFIIDNNSGCYNLLRLPWDGRSEVANYDLIKSFCLQLAKPRGMCIDSTGAIYITFDGNDETRVIKKVEPDGSSHDLIDFYTHFEGIKAGRWGDITILDGVLYLIDKQNDRIAYISSSTGNYRDEYVNTAFSLQGAVLENERYGIAVSP